MRDEGDLVRFENEEQADWARLTPVQRYIESCKLWPTYLALGGSLDPQPDSRSPFDFQNWSLRFLLMSGQACILCGGADGAHHG